MAVVDDFDIDSINSAVSSAFGRKSTPPVKTPSSREQESLRILQAEYELKAQFEQMMLQGQMQLQQLKNQGSYTVAEINSDSKVNVQESANRGKIISEQVASETKKETDRMKMHGDMMKHHDMMKHKESKSE